MLRIKCHNHSRSSNGPRWWLITADDQKTCAVPRPPGVRTSSSHRGRSSYSGPWLSGNLGVLACCKGTLRLTCCHTDRAWASFAIGPSLLPVVGSERQRMGGVWGLGNDSILCWHWFNYSWNAEQRNPWLPASWPVMCQRIKDRGNKHSYNEGLPSAGWATPN